MLRGGVLSLAALCAVLACACAADDAAAEDASRSSPPSPPAPGTNVSYELAARAAAADAALPPPLASLLTATGSQLDKCGSQMRDADAAYISNQGGMARLAEDLHAIDAAARRCGVSVSSAEPGPEPLSKFAMWSTHGAAASSALRERMRDLGHHAKFVRAMVAPCVMATPSDAPPETGAWALNAYLHAARNGLEAKRGCLARDAPMHAAPVCGCSRAVSIAAAITFASTATAAAALGAVLRRRAQPWSAAAPRRRLRGAAALGSSVTFGDADDTLSAAAHKKRHSFSGPEPPRPYRQLDAHATPAGGRNDGSV